MNFNSPQKIGMEGDPTKEWDQGGGLDRVPDVQVPDSDRIKQGQVDQMRRRGRNVIGGGFNGSVSWVLDEEVDGKKKNDLPN